MPETKKKMKQAYNMYKDRVGKGSSKMTYQQFVDNYKKTRAKTENLNPRRKEIKKGLKSRYGSDWEKDKPTARLKKKK